MRPENARWRMFISAAVVLALLYFWWPRQGAESEELVTPSEVGLTDVPEVIPGAENARSFVVTGNDPLMGRVGAGLNAAEGSVQRDLAILQDVFAAWRSNADGRGNPVGSNREITAALAGQNRWGFAIIPPDHPAINARGELCDRWGSPLFFHQLSGERMEIVSFGPDGERGTEDDVVVSP